MRGAADTGTTADISLAQGFRSLAKCIGRGFVADPKAKPEMHSAPLGNVRLADVFAGAEQGRSALKLLQREQAQRVAHEHGNAVIAGAAFDVLLQPAHGEHIGGEAKIGFRLAAAGGEPEEVGNGVGFVAAVGMIKAGDAGQVQQHERELEHAPCPVLWHVERVNG